MPAVAGSRAPAKQAARAEARAQHRRLLDPQGGWHQHPADLRGGRRQGERHRHPEVNRGRAPQRIALVRPRADPYCNLTDGLDMAVPVFGPIELDELARPDRPPPPRRLGRSHQCRDPADAGPVKVLIITGDTVSAHNWKETTAELTKILEAGGKAKVSVTTTPSKDLNDENLSKYDVLLLNYFDTRLRCTRNPLVRRKQGGVPEGGARRQGVGRVPSCLGRIC